MATSKNNTVNFRRWAVVGVVAPAIIILAVRFIIFPQLFHSDVGDAIGLLFILWLLVVTLAAVAATLWRSRHAR